MNNYKNKVFGILLDRLTNKTENRKIFWHRETDDCGKITFTPTFNTFYDETRVFLEGKNIVLSIDIDKPDTIPVSFEFVTYTGSKEMIEVTLNDKDLWGSMLSLLASALKSSKYVDACINEMLDYLNKL